jgi:molecular chaperone DnaK (HSP70)
VRANLVGISLLVCTTAAASCGRVVTSPSTGENHSGESRRVVLREPIGIETAGGGFDELVPSGIELPLWHYQDFTTDTDDQSQIELHVLAGTAERRSMGRFTVAKLTPAPRGVTRVQIVVQVDKSGRLSVAAVDRAAGERPLPVSRSVPASDSVVSVGPE